jgi:hypothetical protein
LRGYWINPTTANAKNASDVSSLHINIYACNPPEVCLGYDESVGGCTSPGCCGEHLTGVLCGSCESDDFIKHNGACIQCSQASFGRIFALICFYLMVGLYLTIKTRKVKDATGSTAIITGFCQTVALYGKPMWRYWITRKHHTAFLPISIV